eukprot:886693_1
MSTLLEQRTKLQTDYKQHAAYSTTEEYATFFEDHKTDILSSTDSWFMEELIYSNKIEIMKYILQKYDMSKHIKTKIGLNRGGYGYQHSYPLGLAACIGSFEMIRLLIANGGEPDNVNDYCSNLIYNIIYSGNHKRYFEDNDIYLSIQYLLNHIKQNSRISRHVMRIITEHSADHSMRRFDAIQICKLIESKIPFLKQTADEDMITSAIQGKHFELLEFLANEVGINIDEKLNANMFGQYSWGYINKPIIQWLLQHNVDLNGFITEGKGVSSGDRITPLFHRCIDKKYNEMELLLDFGADIHKKCIYKKEELSSLEFCVKTFPKEYAD